MTNALFDIINNKYYVLYCYNTCYYRKLKIKSIMCFILIYFIILMLYEIIINY